MYVVDCGGLFVKSVYLRALVCFDGRLSSMKVLF